MLHRFSIIDTIVINIMIIEVMAKATSPSSFVDFRPRDVIGGSACCAFPLLSTVMFSMNIMILPTLYMFIICDTFCVNVFSYISILSNVLM